MAWENQNSLCATPPPPSPPKKKWGEDDKVEVEKFLNFKVSQPGQIDQNYHWSICLVNSPLKTYFQCTLLMTFGILRDLPSTPWPMWRNTGQLWLYGAVKGFSKEASNRPLLLWQKLKVFIVIFSFLILNLYCVTWWVYACHVVSKENNFLGGGKGENIVFWILWREPSRELEVWCSVYSNVPEGRWNCSGLPSCCKGPERTGIRASSRRVIRKL